MRKNVFAKLMAIVIVIIAVFAYYISPLAHSIKQGLDLQGGTHVVLEAIDTPEAPVNDDAVNRVVKIIERRVNELGLTEPIIQREGSRRIIVELPGVKDPEKAIEMLGKTAMLEFKDEAGVTALNGTDLKDAHAQIDQANKNLVALEFTEEGAQKFADLTTKNIGKKIAVLLDKKVLTNPTVNEPITGGKAVITGSQTIEEAQNLAILMRSGSLPVKVDIVETRTVGPTLGQDSKDKSEFAFMVGIGAIIIFIDAGVILYVNSIAEAKQHADTLCTSANALKVTESLPQDEILFGPDNNLGSNVAKQTSKEIIPVPKGGHCYVHKLFHIEDVELKRKQHPDAEIICHPECNMDVQEACDKVLSTGGMLKYIAQSDKKEFVIGTEIDMITRLESEIPGKKLYPLLEGAICSTMKLHTLEKVRNALKNEEPQVTVPKEIAEKSLKATQHMLKVSK